MRKLGVQYICDVCGRTMFMAGQDKSRHAKAPVPLGWTKLRTNKTRHLCALCTGEYEAAKKKIREYEGRFDPEPGEPEQTTVLTGEVID